MRRLAVVILPALALACSSAPRLTVVSRDKAFRLSQKFSVVAMSPPPEQGAASGDLDVVLVAQGTEASSSQPGEVLLPSSVPPIRQVVHLRLHWRPYPGSTADNPASSNATLRWVMFPSSGDLATSSDLVEYAGTAFVRPSFSRDGAWLSIRAGDVRPVVVRGHMTDALGPANFTGHFFAKYDESTVATALRGLPAAGPVAADK